MPKSIVRRILREELQGPDGEHALAREWLVTNGLGGYASGTISGVATRRYHALLIAALPAPLGRRVLLSHLSERLRLPDRTLVKLSGERIQDDELFLYGAHHLAEFRLEAGLPVWRYEVAGVTLEKRILLPHEQNTVYIIYRLLEGDAPVRVKLMPSLHNRAHDDPVSTPLPAHFQMAENQGKYEFVASPDLPALRMVLYAQHQAFTVERRTIPEVLYEVEESRGYDFRGHLWSPGYFRFDLSLDQPATLVASLEPWEVVAALSPEFALQAEYERRERLLNAAPEEARHGMAAELVLAADQFLIRPVGRTEAAARARARGDEVRTVIAGYHWFTDWGRDTMISLEGLTLATGRVDEAGRILRTFAHSVRDGLLPNLFPEGEREGLYHTADATLWFFHALDRYLERSADRATLEMMIPILLDIVEHHVRGTHFGIGLDPDDGLLRQGAAGYQLTWMDAKVGDWVVTPRRGKAVEINALWYNSLRLLAEWLPGGDGSRWLALAEKSRASFNRRFWYPEGGYLYDVVDGEQGDDPACRPNQVLAISLKYPVLDPQHWEPVMKVAAQRLVTPVGLRSLAPGHADYRNKYYGDLRSRDAAYHQGTVWGWLIGPYLDAWLKLYPERRAEARHLLAGFENHLSLAGIGTISEVFDAESPYAPRGCIAQAWSVAEVLRCYVKLMCPRGSNGSPIATPTARVEKPG